MNTEEIAEALERPDFFYVSGRALSEQTLKQAAEIVRAFGVLREEYRQDLMHLYWLEPLGGTVRRNHDSPEEYAEAVLSAIQASKDNE